MTLQPRLLLPRLLLGAPEETLSVRALVACGALFGIRENSVRVALLRLVASGLVESVDRGTYRLGPRAAGLANEVRAWHGAESRVRPWRGDYVAVSVSGLGRTDRTAVRQRDRAFELLGFRAFAPELYLRPDNLVGGVATVRARLAKLDVDAPVFLVGELDPDRSAAAAALWDGKALTKSYVKTREKVEAWLARTDRSQEVAARESFLLGSAAIRQLVFDPMLPEPLVDIDERRALATAVRAIDRHGRAVWRELITEQMREAA